RLGASLVAQQGDVRLELALGRAAKPGTRQRRAERIVQAAPLRRVARQHERIDARRVAEALRPREGNLEWRCGRGRALSRTRGGFDDGQGQRRPIAQMKQRDVQVLGQDLRAGESIGLLELGGERVDARRGLLVRQGSEEDAVLLRRSEFAARTFGGHDEPYRILHGAAMSFRIKRVYDKPAKADGLRVLVDRLWPRGLKKTDAKLDHWMKEVAP